MLADEDDWLLVGRIVGAFGVRGELKVEPLTDFPERFKRLKSVFVGPNRNERSIVSSRLHARLLLCLEGVETREAAQSLRGQDLWIPRAQAMELPAGSFYVDDIIGLTVETDAGSRVGTVLDILATGANDVYVVEGEQGEILIPAILDVVREIDVGGGRIVIHPMAGLLD